LSYNISFISLGCAKNQVNCEQMMALCAEAGYAIQTEPEGCDVVVVNTCGFLASACGEAIENILEMAELKKEGKIKKILVTGCMTQRYKGDIFNELPEVDGLLGTGSYGDIVSAVAEVMEKGTKPCHLGNIHTANQSGERILSTPPWYAYLRIAEGCDNHCAYCVIPSLRGKYRSRPMNELLDEAAELASAGVMAVIGTYGSAVTEASQNIIDEAEIMQIATGSTSVRLTEKGLPLFFRTCPRDDEQGRVASKVIAAKGFKKVAILHDNSAYAKGLADEAKSSASWTRRVRTSSFLTRWYRESGTIPLS